MARTAELPDWGGATPWPCAPNTTCCLRVRKSLMMQLHVTACCSCSGQYIDIRKVLGLKVPQLVRVLAVTA